jgi:acetoacetate decarboxylase
LSNDRLAGNLVAVGFVKSAEDIAEIERVLSRPRFVNGERLAVEFLTDPATVERLLPPPLEPADKPLASVGIGRWQGNGIGDYAGGSLYLAARYNGIDGGYALAMWMDTEASVTFGRDVFGEPKKLCTTNLFRDGNRFHAWIERHGVRLIDVHAELGDDLGPTQQDRIAFNFKSRPAANGVGLEGPAVLTATTFSATVKNMREGIGSISMAGTVHDPLDEIEVVSVVRAEYQEHDISATCEALATVPAEDFLPYHHGRTDNWLALNSEALAAAGV